MTTSWSLTPAHRLWSLMANGELEWVVGDVGSTRTRPLPHWSPHTQKMTRSGGGASERAVMAYLSVPPLAIRFPLLDGEPGTRVGGSKMALGTIPTHDFMHWASSQSILGLQTKSWFITFTTIVYNTTCQVAADQYRRRTLVGSIIGFWSSGHRWWIPGGNLTRAWAV